MSKNAVLTQEEKNRYARHILLPEIGEAGQKKLKAARVLIVGLGGLGAPVSMYLAAAGVGMLGLTDDDRVDVSNLQRQILYTESDAGKFKLNVAEKRLKALNSYVEIFAHPQKITAENALDIVSGYDIVIDGTDNFASHYLLNDACVLANKPLIYGNVHKFEGLVSTVLPKQGPCYRCLYPSAPPPELTPSCAEAGVLGVVPGMIGTLQAAEALKIILGLGKTLAGRVLLVNGLNAGFREVTLARDPQCPACGERPRITKLVAETPAACANAPEISAEELKCVLKSGTSPFLLDVRQPPEYDLGHLEGAILIPLSELPKRLRELNPERATIVYCQLGKRGQKAAQILMASGFTQVRNLRGGLEGFGRMELDRQDSLR